jgi:hypothetical protein
MKVERFRKYNTRDIYPEQTLDNDLCQVIRAGNQFTCVDKRVSTAIKSPTRKTRLHRPTKPCKM